MVCGAGAQEQRVAEHVARELAADVHVEIRSAVVVDVARRHGGRLLKVPDVRRGRDIGKAAVAPVSEHAVRNQRAKIAAARADVEIHEAIAVEVGGGHAGREHRASEFGARAHVGERSVAAIAVEARTLGTRGQEGVDDRAQCQHVRLLREQEHLHEEVLQFGQKRSSKRGQCIMVGMQIACNEAERHRLIGSALDLARTEHPSRVAIEKQAQQHFGGVGFPTTRPVVGIQG